MLAIGFALGAVSTWLFLGRPVDTGLGGGIKTLIERGSSRQTDARAVSTEKVANLPQAEAPKLEFYNVLPTVLPEIERIIPDDETQETPEPQAQPPSSERPKKVDKVVGYVLQAGSYTRYNDADQMKAKLALAGVEARIQKVTIEGRGEFYRVRVGPFKTLSQADAANQRLRNQGVQAIRLRVTQPTTG